MRLFRDGSALAGGGRAVDDASPDHYRESHVGCNCDTKTIDPSDPWGKGFTRRSLIKGAGYLAAAPLAHQLATTRMAFAQAGAQDLKDVVVTISIRGGWDMNVCPPYGDPIYDDARPNLRIPEGRLLKRDGLFGLNAGLAPLVGPDRTGLWDQGKIAVVQGCALELPNYSHFRASFELEMGDQRQSLGSGWANRLLEARGLVGENPLQAVQFGGAGLPMLLRGAAPAIATASTWEKFAIFGDEGGDRAGALSAINSLEGSPLTGATEDTLAALGAGAEVAARGYEPAVAYPKGNVADALKEIARTMKSGAGLQLAACDVGGWDTHTKMGRGDDPNAGFNLHVADFGAALGAFCADLGDLLNRTLIIVVSEFGRRIPENGGGGTEHGYGQPMILIGGRINGGRFISNNYDLAEDENENVKRSYDYRQIIAECLVKGGHIGNVQAVFPGLQYDGGLGVVKG